MAEWGPPTATPASPRIEITSRTGSITVRAIDGSAVVVAGGRGRFDADGVMDAGTDSVEIHCPPGTDVVVASRTGEVRCHGPLGRVFASTRTGSVRIEAATEVDVRSRTGSVDVGACAGRCAVVVATGKVQVDRAGAAEVCTSTGKITVDDAVDAVLSTATGSVRLGTHGAGTVRIRSVSGRVRVGLAPDANPETKLRSLTGRVRRRDARDGALDGSVMVETVSGSIDVE